MRQQKLALLIVVIALGCVLFGQPIQPVDILYPPGADYWIVGTATGVWAWETGATARTSLGVGTGDVVTFTDLYLGDFSGGNETIDEILDDIIIEGILDAITVSADAGVGNTGLDISWTTGEIWDSANLTVVDTTSASAQTCSDDVVNILKWSSGTGLTLGTSLPTGAEVIIASINCSDGVIWEINQIPIISEITGELAIAFQLMFPSVITDGLVVSEHAGGNAFDVDMTGGTYFSRIYGRETVAAQDSSVGNDLMTLWYRSDTGEWTAVVDKNDIDVTQWNDANSLSNVSTPNYYKSLFFVTDQGINWLYPTAEYTTVAQAIAGPDPILPAGLTDHPKSTAVVIKWNDAAFPTAGGDRWIDRRPIIGGEISGVVSDHGNLAGLGDAVDHTWALLTDGTRALAGAWDMGSQATTNVNIDSGTINGITDLAVADGGTGASSLNDGFVLLGSNTAAITPLDVTTDGGIIIGDGTTDPVVLDVGSSTAITILGTVGTGVWQGTAIADGYIPNNITIDLATLATTVTVSDDESTNDNQEIVFTTDNTNLESDGDFHYNPSTGTVTATEFVGGGAGLTALLKADGTVALAGAWDMDSQNTTNVDIDSGTIDGLSTLTVDGSTVLTNASFPLYLRFDPSNYLGLEAQSDGDFEMNSSKANYHLDFTDGRLITTNNIEIGDANYIGSISDKDAMQIEGDGDIVMTQDLAVTGITTATGGVTIGGGLYGTSKFTLRDATNAQLVSIGDTAGFQFLLDDTPSKGARMLLDSGGNMTLGLNSGAGWVNTFTMQNASKHTGFGATLTADLVSQVYVEATHNALAGATIDVSELHLLLRNPANDTGEAVGMGFCLSTSATVGIGAAIAHERAGSNSYGNLHFATKASGGGADIPIRMTIEHTGDVGIGLVAPTSQLHVDQSSASGAQPVARLDQGDVDDSFIDFVGTSAGDATKSISTLTTSGATTHHIRCEINGATVWIACSTNDPS